MNDYAKLDDRALAALLQQGDQRAFTAIYERYFWLLHNHAYRWLRERETVKDLLHELFAELWAKHGNINPEKPFATYLYTSVRNRVFNHLERSRYSVRYSDSLEEFLKDGECITDHLLRERLLSEVIEAGIRDMPKKMREVFELSRKQQLSHREIAEQLNISEETVRKHIQHALRLLRPRLEMVLVFWLFSGLK